MAVEQLAQPAQAIALQQVGVQLHPQALRQAGTRLLQAHHALGAQAQSAGEVVLADLALDHHQRVGLQQRLGRGEGFGEQRGLDPSGAVVEGDEAHLVALLVLHHPQVDDQPGHRLGIARRLQLDDALAGEAPHLAFVLVDRMAGQVKAEGVLLALQAFLEGQLLDLAVVGVDIRLRLGEDSAEQVHVPAVVAARGLLGGLDRFLHRRQQHGAVEVDGSLVGL